MQQVTPQKERQTLILLIPEYSKGDGWSEHMMEKRLIFLCNTILSNCEHWQTLKCNYRSFHASQRNAVSWKGAEAAADLSSVTVQLKGLLSSKSYEQNLGVCLEFRNCLHRIKVLCNIGAAQQVSLQGASQKQSRMGFPCIWSCVVSAGGYHFATTNFTEW